MSTISPGHRPVAGHFCLLVRSCITRRLFNIACPSFDALATTSLDHPPGSAWPDTLDRYERLGAFSPNGKTLNLTEVVAHGARLRARRRRYHRGGAFVFRDGPVEGIYRHGHYGYWRHVATMGARRQSVVVAKADGEVAPRAARSGRFLPSSWDDIARCLDRSWKAQRKGRKAWDR